MSDAPMSAPRPYDTVTLLTDYGHADEFVGVLHSVLRQMAPDVAIIDLAHDLAPFDVRAASLVLARSAQYLCPGVIVGVVDPEVGTDRRAVAIEVLGGRAVFVGPDNGLFAGAVGMVGGSDRAVVLTNTELHLPSHASTFDGRDIFVPVSAHLCNGVPFDELGEPLDTALLKPGLMPLPRLEDGQHVGEVLWIDRFGNCQLNIDPDELAGERFRLVADGRGHNLTRVLTFAEVPAGALGLVTDASGLVAVVANRASAAEVLGIGEGAEVTIGPLEADPGITTPVELGRR